MPELIFTSVVRAHNYLNTESAHWIWHRYKYKAIHSSGGINIGLDEDEDEEFSGIVWAMLQTHYEFTAAISACSKESAKNSLATLKMIQEILTQKKVSIAENVFLLWKKLEL